MRWRSWVAVRWINHCACERSQCETDRFERFDTKPLVYRPQRYCCVASAIFHIFRPKQTSVDKWYFAEIRSNDQTLFPKRVSFLFERSPIQMACRAIERPHAMCFGEIRRSGRLSSINVMTGNGSFSPEYFGEIRVVPSLLCDLSVFVGSLSDFWLNWCLLATTN